MGMCVVPAIPHPGAAPSGTAPNPDSDAGHREGPGAPRPPLCAAARVGRSVSRPTSRFGRFSSRP